MVPSDIVIPVPALNFSLTSDVLSCVFVSVSINVCKLAIVISFSALALVSYIAKVSPVAPPVPISAKPAMSNENAVLLKLKPPADVAV